MQSNNHPEPADQVLASALQSIRPAAVTIDPIAAAYAAGRRTSARHTRAWQGLAALCIVLSCVAWLRPQFPGNHVLPPENRSSPVIVSSVNLPIAPLSEQSAFNLQRAVLLRGLDSLPRSQSASSAPVNIQDLY